MSAPTPPAAAMEAAPSQGLDAWKPWQHTQPLILRGMPGASVRYLFLRIRPGQARQAREGLARLVRRVIEDSWTLEPASGACLQLGWTFEGLEALALPGAPVCAELLDDLARRAPAFAQGARRRAPRWLGDVGDSAPHRWEPAFLRGPHLVLSLHARDPSRLDPATKEVQQAAGVDEPQGAWSWDPATREDAGRPVRDGRPGLPIPLGLRDGITQLRFQGVPVNSQTGRPRPPEGVEHPVGDVLLGHRNREGAQPWALPAGRTVPGAGLYPDSSFGILRKMALHPQAWEAYLAQVARAYEGVNTDQVAAGLLGRHADGRPLLGAGAQAPGDPTGWDQFSHHDDPQGRGCPFGAHIRRMNPRGDPLLVDRRPRPLLRRGLPYERRDPSGQAVVDQGLLGLFFCADIEEQFEHLLGQWGRHDALGSRNAGSAQDPFAPGDRDGRPFAFPGWTRSAHPEPPLPSLTTTRGTLYLWYPSLPALQRMAGPAPGQRVA